MPSLMATLGIDTSNFNRKVEEVVAKTKKVQSEVDKNLNRASSTAAQAQTRRINFTRTTGLASDPTPFIEESAKAKSQTSEQLRKAEREAAKREMDEFRRQDAISREQARAARRATAERMAADRADARARQAQQDADHKRWVRQQKNVQKEVAEVGKDFEKSRKGGMLGGSPLGGAVKMFAGFATADFIVSKSKQTMDYASTLTAMSGRLNASTTDLQAWNTALENNGSSLATVEPMLDKLNKSRILALQGNAKQMDAFSQLGISEEQLRTMGTLDLMGQIGRGFDTDGSEEMIAALQRVAGDGATTFVETFQGGLDQAIQEAKDSGTLMSEGMVASWKQMGDQWTSIAQTLGAAVATLLQPVVWFVTELTDQVVGAMKMLGALQTGVVKGMAEGWKEGGLTGAIKGAFSGAGEELSDFTDKENQKREERNNAIQRAKLGIRDDPKTNINATNKTKAKEDAKDAEKEAKDRERAEQEEEKNANARAKRIQAIKQQLAEKQFSNSMIGKDDEDKIVALDERWAELEDRLKLVRDEEEALGVDNEEEELGIEKQIEGVAGDMFTIGEREREKFARLGKHSTSSFQQMGGFLGNFSAAAGPEMAALNVQQRSENHLQKINTNIARLVQLAGKGTTPDVDY